MAMMDALAKKAFWELLELLDPDAHEQLSRPVTMQMTRREMETLEYLGYGMTSNEMGATLGLSAHTVDWYMNGIQDKAAGQESPSRGGDRLPARSHLIEPVIFSWN
jgi:LuxR family transcriptional regulator